MTKYQASKLHLTRLWCTTTDALLDPMELWCTPGGELRLNFTYYPRSPQKHYSIGVGTIILSNLPFLLNDRVVELANLSQILPLRHVHQQAYFGDPPGIPLIDGDSIYSAVPHLFLRARLGMPYGND